MGKRRVAFNKQSLTESFVGRIGLKGNELRV